MADIPNAEQIEYWNESRGPDWVAGQEWLDALIASAGARALTAARIAPGEHVLDVGCGCGQTTLEIARSVGRAGRVVGLDISRPMLARARERAAQAGLEQVHFVEGDAQVHVFEPGPVPSDPRAPAAGGARTPAGRDLARGSFARRHGFDLLFSRFGVMFFEDPVAAFANLRAAAAPSGRLAFVCWQRLAENPWMRIPVEVAGRHVALPAPPHPHAPGPFALADPDRLVRILADAGWDGVSVEPAPVELEVAPGQPVERAVEFLLRLGPAGRALREAGAAAFAEVASELIEAVAAFATPAGLVLPASVYVVTARSGPERPETR